MIDLTRIAQHITAASGQVFHVRKSTRIGGGCINSAFKLSDGDQHWFIKLNGADRHEMFAAEYAGLAALAASNSIRVPLPLCTGILDNQSYIVMEYIRSGVAGRDGQRKAGEQLAALHRHQADQFGWQRDNTLGTTEQRNTWHDNWLSFWRDQRLGFQLQLAAHNGYTGKLQQHGEKLRQQLPELLFHTPAPSLLHGDLWGGNISFDSRGEPVIYDPATYYGDRETDIAMTELFGGFSNDFYRAYNDTWPLDADYQIRKILYNLYHVLNHLNLFGGGYASQADEMIQRLLAELA